MEYSFFLTQEAAFTEQIVLFAITIEVFTETRLKVHHDKPKASVKPGPHAVVFAVL